MVSQWTGDIIMNLRRVNEFWKAKTEHTDRHEVRKLTVFKLGSEPAKPPKFLQNKAGWTYFSFTHCTDSPGICTSFTLGTQTRPIAIRYCLILKGRTYTQQNKSRRYTIPRHAADHGFIAWTPEKHHTVVFSQPVQCHWSTLRDHWASQEPIPAHICGLHLQLTLPG